MCAGHDEMGEARDGAGPPGGASVGVGHLIEENKQAQPGPRPSNQASSTSSSSSSSSSKQREGERAETNQGSTRLPVPR